MTIAYDINESGHYETNCLLGVWSLWKQIDDINGLPTSVCLYPPDYQGVRDTVIPHGRVVMNDESHIFAELLGDEDLLADKKVLGKAKVQGHDLTLEQFTLPEGWQEQFPGVPREKHLIEAVHIHSKAPEKK